MNNTFATSDMLRNEIQGQQPGKYEITKKLQLILSQYGTTPNTKRIIEESRIPTLVDEASELAKLTGDQLAALRLEMMVGNRMTSYQNELNALLERTPKVIESIMMQDWGKAA